jgi:hypothetical protein
MLPASFAPHLPFFDLPEEIINLFSLETEFGTPLGPSEIENAKFDFQGIMRLSTSYARLDHLDLYRPAQ